MKKYLSILKKCPLFADIDEAELLRMLTCLDAQICRFEKKYTVFSEGQPAKHVGVMLSGSAQILQNDYYGNRTIIGGVRAGELFAEAFACASVATLPVSVVAVEECEVMLIHRDRILYTCQNGCGFHQRLIFNLMRDLATKALAFHQRIEVTSKRTTREKLMTYLLACAKEKNSRSFEIPFDRQELADYLEVERSGLSAEIGKLRREGILESRKHHFRLL